MKNPVDELFDKISFIEERLHYSFANRDLLLLAFVHRSFFNEHRDLVSQHNERLEFLGDSVLGLLISDYLYAEYPYEPEGTLSHLRSAVVEASSCAKFLSQLQITQYILLGKGERMNDGKGRETIYADLFEALIGAIYLDGGLEVTKRFFFSHFSQILEEHLKRPLRNWKAELQDFAQKKYQRPPIYKILKESGPDHSKMFQVVVSVNGKDVGEGTGSSKKEAEQAAANDALTKLGVP